MSADRAEGHFLESVLDFGLYSSTDGSGRMEPTTWEVVHMIDPVEARQFLTGGLIAVIGASDDPHNFGRTVCEALRDHGRQVVAVHPAAETVAGVPCYRSIRAVPERVATAIIMVPRALACTVVADALASGVERIWLFKGAGPGSDSVDAVQLYHEAGVKMIAGACPLMFLEPVRGVHRVHSWLRRLSGAVGTAA